MRRKYIQSGGFGNRKSFAAFAGLAGSGNGATGIVNQAQLYVSNRNSSIPGYESLMPILENNSHSWSINVKAADGEKLIVACACPLAGVEYLRAGIWNFQTVLKVDTPGITSVVIRAYYRTPAGLETELLNLTTPLITNSTYGKVYNLHKWIAENHAILHDDAIVVKYFAQTTSPTDVPIDLITHDDRIINGEPATTNIVISMQAFTLLGNEIEGLSNKPDPVPTDILLIEDSEENFTKKKVLVSSVGAQSLDDLTDVIITAPAHDEVLSYNGSEWVNKVPPSSGGVAVAYFLDDTASGVGGYSSLVKTPSGLPEDIDTVNINAASGKTLIEGYSTAAALGRTTIEGGVWAFQLFAYVDNVVGVSQIIFDVYKRTSGGTETLLFSVTSPDINNTTVTLYTIETVQAAFALNATDFLVVKVSAQTTSAALRAISMTHNGTQHYTHFDTPLNVLHNELSGLQGGVAGQYYHQNAITRFPEFQFFADQMRSAMFAELPKSTSATLANDSAKEGILERQFDDTTDEGVLIDIFIPANTTNIIFEMHHRPQTAPADATKLVALAIYTRQMPDNAAPGSWSSEYELTNLTFPANTNWQYDSQTIALSTLGLTAGQWTQIEFVRDAAEPTDDTLVGDWNLALLRIRFS